MVRKKKRTLRELRTDSLCCKVITIHGIRRDMAFTLPQNVSKFIEGLILPIDVSDKYVLFEPALKTLCVSGRNWKFLVLR